MKVLLLGPCRPEMIEFLSSLGDSVINTELLLDDQSELINETEFIISYGYRYILKKAILDRFPNRAINLHISLLPWNRGSDPNLWSFLEDTPKGVTIHYLDQGLDTGDIIAQQSVKMLLDDTLQTSYEKLSVSIFDLFKKTWPDIRLHKNFSFPQPSGGTFHKSADREIYQELLYLGWDTPVAHLIGKALKK